MGGLPIQTEWKDEAERRLQKHGVTVKKYVSKIFRTDFFKTIGLVHWQRLIATPELKQMSKIKLADQLGLSQASQSRWTTGAHEAGADKFFAVVLLVLKRDLSQLNLGNQNAVLFHAIQRQHEQLTAKFYKQPSCELEQFVFRSVLRAMSVPEVNALVPKKKVGKAVNAAREAALKEVASRLNATLRHEFNENATRSANFKGKLREVLPSEIDAWLASWGVPYTLFAMGCTRNWGIEHV